MNTYRVSRLLDSAAYLPAAISARGVTFEHPDPESSRLLAWVDVQSASWREALLSADASILRMADAIVACQLAAISTYGAPTLIHKERAEVACLIWGVKDEERWHIDTFEAGVVDDIERTAGELESDPGLESGARHFRESLLASNVLASVMQILRATEALAPGKSKGFTCRACQANPLVCEQCGTAASTVRTNKSGLEALMGSSLYDYFYGSGGLRGKGVRNDLMHGHLVDQQDVQAKTNALRQIIQTTLATRLNITTQPAIRPRGLISYRGARWWIAAPTLPDLAVLERMTKDDALDFDSNPRLLQSDEALSNDGTY